MNLGKAIITASSSIIMAASLSIAESVRADDLSELGIYSRCYARLVRLIPSQTDPLYAKVAAGRMTGADACMNLYDSAMFGTNGVMVNRTDAQARRVVKTLNDFHKTWFQQRAPISTGGAELLVFDMEEPALYFTRAAFQTAVPFSSVVTLTNGLGGVRDRIAGAGTGTNFQAQTVFNFRSNNTFFNSPDLVLYYEGANTSTTPVQDIGPVNYTLPGNSIVQVGELVGTQPSIQITLPAMKGPFWMSASQMTNFNATPHFGSGVIGSQTFISDYNPFPLGTFASNYDNIYRRITAHVFEDIMCQQLPTLQIGDVVTEVNLTSQYTFQQSANCLQCHSSIDNAALSYRNLTYWASPFVGGAQAQPMSGFTLAPDGGTNAHYYFEQTPTGRLHYRELITQNMQDFTLNGIQSIGPLIAAGNDLYTCAASRYYQFFTGITVNLAQPATTPVDIYHQKMVLQFGKDLKAGQSVRGLISEIVHSDPFKSTNYKATGDQ